MADDARSYRSKVGAMRIILKNVHTRRALIKYVEVFEKSEYVKCFQELEEVRILKDDKQFKQQLKNLLANYKSVMEVAEQKNSDMNCIEFALWDCFGPLRHADIDTCTTLLINKYVHVAQDSLLSQVCTLFEQFLQSKEYNECKNYAVDNQKIKRSPRAASRAAPTNANKKEPSIRDSINQPVASSFHGVAPS